MTRRRAPMFKRRRHTRAPKRRFIIFCEGAKTEPAYFHALKHLCSSALIEIETVAPARVPYTIAKSATKRARSLGLGRRRSRARNSFEEHDQVWAVFDRDIHPRFEDAVASCGDRRVGVGRSNPCFEIWLILHEEDHDRPGDRHAVQAHLGKLRPEYERAGAKTPDCTELVTRVEEAERRAETQLTRRRDEGDPYGNPSTTVGRLTRAIRDAASAASLRHAL